VGGGFRNQPFSNLRHWPLNRDGMCITLASHHNKLLVVIGMSKRQDISKNTDANYQNATYYFVRQFRRAKNV
jgi:hypothetical protein